MLLFWIAAALVGALSAVFMARTAAVAGRRSGGEDPAQALYRRQLGEIDDLAGRGLIPQDELIATRTEAARRLLASTDEPRQFQRPARPAVLLALLFVPPLLALGFYLLIGRPGYPDQPYAARLAAWEAADENSLDAPRLAALLRARIKLAPNDPQLRFWLGRMQMASEEPALAAATFRAAIALAPRRADLWEELGMALLFQTGEAKLKDDARAAFEHALSLDPRAVRARYFLARSRIASGETAEGLAAWKTLLAAMPAGADRDELARQIAAVETTGALPGPPPEQTSPEMQAAIQGMVAGLAARLEAQPNDPEGWVRLVRAYQVLGDTARRDAALTRARTLFAGQPQVLAALEGASRGDAP